MTTVEANGVMLGVAHFGDATAPLVLCGQRLCAPHQLRHAD